jgi:choline dehydrogenase-like flavoprotein
MDMQTQVAATKLGRKVFSTAPLSTLSTGESIPGFNNVPNNAPDSAWQDWISNNFVPVSHAIGTCAMMKQSLGGVVNGRLKLYGAQNVRIVDASVMPMQISAHLSSTLYGIAEKVADFIKNNV